MCGSGDEYDSLQRKPGTLSVRGVSHGKFIYLLLRTLPTGRRGKTIMAIRPLVDINETAARVVLYLQLRETEEGERFFTSRWVAGAKIAAINSSSGSSGRSSSRHSSSSPTWLPVAHSYAAYRDAALRVPLTCRSNSCARTYLGSTVSA